MTYRDAQFDAALERFLAGSQAKRAAWFRQFENLTPDRLVVEPGRRYLRIVAENDRGHRSAWAFIDLTSGDVLKAASWRAPAKHARGNIFDASSGLAAVGPQGPAYLR